VRADSVQSFGWSSTVGDVLRTICLFEGGKAVKSFISAVCSEKMKRQRLQTAWPSMVAGGLSSELKMPARTKNSTPYREVKSKAIEIAIKI
jgi:hypothetical protein